MGKVSLSFASCVLAGSLLAAEAQFLDDFKIPMRDGVRLTVNSDRGGIRSDHWVKSEDSRRAHADVREVAV